MARSRLNTDQVGSSGVPIQVASIGFSAVATGTTVIPLDDTIPQITEGDEYMTLSFTPKSATNTLVFSIVVWGSHSAATTDTVAALFQGATPNALAADSVLQSTANGRVAVYLQHTMAAGTTSATTFRVRAGGHQAGTFTFNGIAAARYFGAIVKSSIVITEYKS